jgi:hypothetical protein
VPTEAGRGGPVSGAAEQDRGDTERGRVRGGLAAAVVRVEAMREREAGERKGRLRYYTRLCSSGRHINRRT